MLLNLIILIIFCYLAIKTMKAKGVLVIIAIACFVEGLADDTNLSLFGIILFFAWFAWMCVGGSKRPEVEKEIQARTKTQKKEEEDWGIIDFSEKK